jgi:hypothetical protein
MSTAANPILAHFRRVDAERLLRVSTPGLAAKVDAIKHYQHRRFSLTYADLLGSDRYGPAASFFLNELYGPRDFAERDAQFAKVVPAIVRLFPRQLVDTVAALAELHELSEHLDTAMGIALPSVDVNAEAYTLAWQRSSDLTGRERQIALMVDLGRSIDSLTRKPLLRKSLQMMRSPAQAAGLGQLQGLLESGFDAFGWMRGAEEFLATVESRERSLAIRLFTTKRDDRARVEADRVWEGLP